MNYKILYLDEWILVRKVEEDEALENGVKEPYYVDENGDPYFEFEIDDVVAI